MKKSSLFSILLIILLLLTISTIASAEGNLKKDSVEIKKNTKNKAFVISARSVNKNREAKSAVIGDFLEININNLDYLLNTGDTCCLELKDTLVVLSFNGLAHPDIHANSFNRSTNSVIFYLDRNSDTFKKLNQKKSSPMDKTELSDISLCIKGNPPLPTGVSKFSLYFTSPQIKLWTLLIIIIFLLAFYILAKYTNVLQIGKGDTRFSLAQTQMAFWTLIVSSSVIYIYLTTGNLPDLSNTSLELMGISIATTAISKSLTVSNRNKPTEKPKTKSFLADIISDNDGVALHRFQMVLWTVILGIIFARKVYFNQQMPDIPDNYLVLTGISSGTYVLLKTVESRDKQDSTDDSEIPAMG